MSATTTGIGTSLSVAYFKRTFYSDNRDAATASKRTSYSRAGLAGADASALRRAAKRLRSFSYSENEDTSIRNSVSAYVDTFNNLVASAEKNGDRKLERTLKQMKSLNSEYEDALDDIGITVNSDGTLTARSSMLSSADISKFEKLFSKDADYIQRAGSYAKRLGSRLSALTDLEFQEKNNAAQAADSTSASSSATEAAQLVASALALQQREGLGNQVDLYL